VASLGCFWASVALRLSGQLLTEVACISLNGRSAHARFRRLDRGLAAGYGVMVAAPQGGRLVEFQVLGSFRVVAEGRSLPLGGYKQRALLAALLLERNRPVSADRLIDALWGERAPASAANSVQVYVSRLRRTLASACRDAQLLTKPTGYVLAVRDDDVDAEQFERLLAEGREALRAGEAARAEAVLARALGLWRGSPLADFVLESFARNEIARLEELHLRATAARIEAVLALGRHAEALSELQALVAEHPLDEEIRAHLMLAMYRSGRPADALASYRDLRRLLRDELGLDPSPELRELERAILRQEWALKVGAVAGEGSAEVNVRPTRSRDERKMVTLLVAALDGVGDEQGDPEDIGAVLAPYRHRLIDEVKRYGGALVTALGGSVAAVFGAPSAHDDDAERAVRAALAIRDWTGAAGVGQVRVGIEAGDALVSFDADAAPAELVVTGDVVNAVLRLQAAAPPGGSSSGRARSEWRVTQSSSGRRRRTGAPDGHGRRFVRTTMTSSAAA
jgi:DNA-binding SARP family transcriptional activator